MYTRNNIKKISNLTVDLWKIENLFLLLNFHTRFLRTRHHDVSKSPPYNTPKAKHTSQQQTTKRTNHHPRSHPMAVTAKTPRGGTPPWRIEPNQPKDDGQSANDARSQKKCKGASGDTCSTNDDGKTMTKSRKRSSAEGDNDEDKSAGAKEAPGGQKTFDGALRP